MIHYIITPSAVNHHLFSVELYFSCQKDKKYQLALPAWLPGSYMIRDFAKNIIKLKATNENNQSIPVIKLDKQTWEITATSQQLTIHYQVFAFDLSVRTAYLDNQRGFFNGSSTFLAVSEEGEENKKTLLKNKPHTLTINPPENIQSWRVATGLPREKQTEKYSFGTYIAENYNHLIDSPVAIGDFDSFEFTVEGVIHHMIFTSRHFGDRERLTRDLRKICQHHINLFTEAPFKEYWFITHLLADGFGGLEHKNSTVLQAGRFNLPNSNNPDEMTDEYITFLSLCSHEYFHAWNVCRIKPKEFTPYCLQNEIYTTQLWAYEGFTSYYDDFSLYRTGLINFKQYLTLLEKTATRVYRGNGELKQSVSESSFYTWTKFYQQGADAVNNIVSYYTKGALIALWLDLTIREKSKGQYSLDTLMRELWIHFGRTNIGTQEDDFINITNILCNEDLTNDIKNLLHDAKRIDLSEKLNNVGITFTKQKYQKLNTLKMSSDDKYIPYLGAFYTKAITDTGVKITAVIENSPTAKAGLIVNDILIAVDSLKITPDSLQKLANHFSENTIVDCYYFRDDQLHSSKIQFIDSPLAGVGFIVNDEVKVKRWQLII